MLMLIYVKFNVYLMFFSVSLCLDNWMMEILVIVTIEIEIEIIE